MKGVVFFLVCFLSLEGYAGNGRKNYRDEISGDPTGGYTGMNTDKRKQAINRGQKQNVTLNCTFTDFYNVRRSWKWTSAGGPADPRRAEAECQKKASQGKFCSCR